MTVPATVVFDFAGESFAAKARELMATTSTETPVAVAVPAWFGMADRHQLIAHLDPRAARRIGLVSSSLAAAHGRYPTRSARRSKAPVLVLDVRLGWSAGLIQFPPDGPTEVAAWGIGPHDVAGRLDDAATSPWLIDSLFSAASAIPGTDSIRAVLVVDDAGDRTALVRQAVGQSTHPLARCPVNAGSGKELVDGGAAILFRSEDAPPSVGALPYALMVRADGDPQRLAMHVVADEHSLFPSTRRQLFELGRDDGAPLHFDVYEQHRSAPGHDNVDHRLVVRADLVRERGYDQNMMVTFELGSNGLLSIGPVNAWRLDWQPGSLDLGSSR